MKTLNIAIAILALALTTLCWADQQTAVDFGGKTKEGLCWKLVQRNFNPGPVEMEFDLGRDLTKMVRISGAYLTDDKGREFIGPMVGLNRKVGYQSVGGTVTTFQGIGNDSKVRVIGMGTVPIGQRVSIGLFGLWSKTEGKDAYWEYGPAVRVRVGKSLTLHVQPIKKVGEKKGTNLFLSMQL